MNKKYLLFASLLWSICALAQTNTEVYLFDFHPEYGLSNPVNVSKNPGAYDNQPSFPDNETLVFSATRNGQTDIKKLDLRTMEATWVTQTDGSEYSPLKVPGRNALSSIRLETDGKQQLFLYDLDLKTSKVLVSDLVVGYHTWYTSSILVSFVLGEESSLVVSDLVKNTNLVYQKNIGRSLHRIPNTELVSYISKQKDNWEIRSLHPLTGEMKFITQVYENTEDMCWTPNGIILMAHGTQLYEYDTKRSKTWNYGQNLAEFGLGGITRMAISPDGRKMAIVVTEQPPEAIVQQQLDAYNNRDIFAFLDTFSDDIALYRFPNTLISRGKIALRKQYESFFQNTPDLHCEIKNRIVQGNKVIDQEHVRMNGQYLDAIAIYEIEKGKISKVTFIQ